MQIQPKHDPKYNIPAPSRTRIEASARALELLIRRGLISCHPQEPNRLFTGNSEMIHRDEFAYIGNIYLKGSFAKLLKDNLFIPDTETIVSHVETVDFGNLYKVNAEFLAELIHWGLDFERLNIQCMIFNQKMKLKQLIQDHELQINNLENFCIGREASR